MKGCDKRGCDNTACKELLLPHTWRGVVLWGGVTTLLVKIPCCRTAAVEAVEAAFEGTEVSHLHVVG